MMRDFGEQSYASRFCGASPPSRAGGQDDFTFSASQAARRSVPVRAPGLTLRDLSIDRSRCS
jgi:hypothetical protein